jgi:hypothetical protein
VRPWVTGFGEFIMSLLRLIVGAYAAAATIAYAQIPVTPAPSTGGQKLQYQSAFAGYRSFSEIETVPWRQANDELGAAAGHAGNAMNRGMPSMAPKAGRTSPAPSATEAPAGHAGHKR